MSRARNIIAVARVSALLLVVVAAGCEQMLNYYLPFFIGTWVLRGSVLLLAGLFGLYLFQHGISVLQRLLVMSGFGLLVALPAVYFWNASHQWQPSVGLLPVPHHAFLPAGAYPPGSEMGIWLGLAFGAVLGTTALLRTRQREFVLGFMVTVGFVLAVWVLCHRAIPRKYPIYDWTGWFVSRNHFAAFACLLFPVTVAMGLRIQRRAFYAGKLSSPAILFYLAAGVLAFSIVESGSRAGMGILVLQSMALVTGYGCHQWDVGRRFRVFQGVGATALIIGLIGVVIQRGNWEKVGAHLAFRGELVRDSLAMWQDNLWWGSGPGSYAVVLPYYQSESLHGYYFHYAHNDPVQMLTELGVLGVALLLLGVLLLLKARHDAPLHIPVAFGCFRMEWFGLSLALGGVLLHSLVDFPLQHSHILLLAAVWLGMLARICRKNPDEVVKKSDSIAETAA